MIETCTCKSDRLHIPDLNPAYAIVAAMSVASLRLPLSRPTLMILMVLTKGSIVCFLVKRMDSTRVTIYCMFDAAKVSEFNCDDLNWDVSCKDTRSGYGAIPEPICFVSTLL